MRWSKILIYSFLLPLFGWMTEAGAQDMSVQAGVYNFTDDLANEFYTIAPGLFIGYDAVSWDRLKLNTGFGFTFRTVMYDNHRHLLYFLPIYLTLKYQLVNEGSKLKPFIGAGFSLAGKADENRYFTKTHYAFTYGYHIQAGLVRKIKTRVSLQFDMRYNLLITPAMEEINVSGVVTTLGLLFVLKSVRKSSDDYFCTLLHLQ